MATTEHKNPTVDRTLTWPPGDDLTIVDMHTGGVVGRPRAHPRGRTSESGPNPEDAGAVAAERNTSGVGNGRPGLSAPGPADAWRRVTRGARSLLTPARRIPIALAVVVLAQAWFIAARSTPRPAPGVSHGAGERFAVATTGRGSGVAPKISTPEHPVPARLVVNTVPGGGGVKVDGRSRGTAPVDITGLAPGDHTVVIATRHGTLQQHVRLAPGQQLSLLVPLAAVSGSATAENRAAAGGWIRVETRTMLSVFEDGQLIGTSEADRLPLQPGRHVLDFVNEAIGYRAAQAVAVSPGRTATVRVDMPDQAVAINAAPWAEVWVDGRSVGETPLGRVMLSPGPHVVLFRHPDLGERTVRTVVRADAPARVTVDMRK